MLSKQFKDISFLELISLKHVMNSLKTTFKKRDDHKRFYLHVMFFTMLFHVMASEAETQCQFMYTKRMWGWEVATYSNFGMMSVSC